MRWLKHLTTSHRDEKHAAVIDECGLEVYAFYWIVLEVVAASMDKTERCDVAYSASQWSRITYSSEKKSKRYLDALAKHGLLVVAQSDSKIRVSIPNLLKYRDEYSSKPSKVSRQTPDTPPDATPDPLPKMSPLDREAETDTEQNPPIVPQGDEEWTEAQCGEFLKRIGWDGWKNVTPTQCEEIRKLRTKHLPDDRRLDSLLMIVVRFEWFDAFWREYWRSAGKIPAVKSFMAKCPDEDTFYAMTAAVEKQSPEMLKREEKNRPHASTWLNQWRWTDESESASEDMLWEA